MVLDSIVSSPIRRKTFPRDEMGSWSTLVQRHRYLLTALTLLAFLCTIYLYFAVTLGATGSCAGLKGAKRATCELQHAGSSLHSGKLKFF
ncbi:hypothetical protein SLEP1_g21111 [Rubroshorea leprosula]|uniref:Uncharacterized protein n=1 Tax=Rubroshorea leprosula TaxID=152421 RepID=A0AAV5JGV3_9ROSI|nr:hypothetical protein SLEP1_g21111 [Rubroshorea leprosula]